MRYAFLALVCCISQLARGDDQPKTVFGQSFHSGDVSMVIPSDGKSIHAFSPVTGRWAHLPLDAKLPADAAPLLTNEMAVIKTKDTIYAFGSRMKGWVKLKLKNADADFVVSQSSMQVTDGRQLFMINADSDRWEGVDLDSGAVLLPPRD